MSYVQLFPLSLDLGKYLITQRQPPAQENYGAGGHTDNSSW